MEQPWIMHGLYLWAECIRPLKRTEPGRTLRESPAFFPSLCHMLINSRNLATSRRAYAYICVCKSSDVCDQLCLSGTSKFPHRDIEKVSSRWLVRSAEWSSSLAGQPMSPFKSHRKPLAHTYTQTHPMHLRERVIFRWLPAIKTFRCSFFQLPRPRALSRCAEFFQPHP